jgi:hypothetical protein
MRNLIIATAYSITSAILFGAGAISYAISKNAFVYVSVIIAIILFIVSLYKFFGQVDKKKDHIFVSKSTNKDEKQE